MEVLTRLLDWVLHVDGHLLELIEQYGKWTYLILFVIVFCETGLVVTPILPGDSLLFAAGAIAATGALDVWLLAGLLTAAAVLGDAANYALGYWMGPKVFKEGSRFFKQEYLDRTHRFYAKYGNKTIVLARFVPIVRTFAPFVAGVGRMSYPKFAFYNVAGGIVWVAVCTFAGYWFGQVPVVKENFALVVVGIVFVSILPIAVEVIRARLAQRRSLRSTEASAAAGDESGGAESVPRDREDRP